MLKQLPFFHRKRSGSDIFLGDASAFKSGPTHHIDAYTKNTNTRLPTDYEELKSMPAEITDMEEFIKLSERATYCAVKRLPRTVKLKLRTPNRLYTLKTDPTKAEEIIKKLSCEIREI